MTLGKPLAPIVAESSVVRLDAEAPGGFIPVVLTPIRTIPSAPALPDEFLPSGREHRQALCALGRRGCLRRVVGRCVDTISLPPTTIVRFTDFAE